MNLSRRAMLGGGAVVAAGAVATATVLLWPREDRDNDEAPTDAKRVADDLPDGVKLDDKGFAVYAPRGPDSDPVWGAGVRLSNAGNTDRWITVAYLPLGSGGSAIGDEINPGGKLPLPAGGELRVGVMELVSAKVGDAVNGLAVRVYAHDDDVEAAVIETKVRDLSYDDPFDSVEFIALNDNEKVEAPDYGLLYYDARGDIIGGWHTNRLAWDSIEDALPSAESDVYPTGESDHTVPVWLPPDIDVDQVAMSLWSEL